MPNISECSGPTLTYFTGPTGTLVGMIFQIFVSQSPKRRCYGNELNMGDVRKRRVGPPLLFASAFDNGLANRKSAFKRFNGNNQATLSKFGELMSSNLGVFAVKTSNFCQDSPSKSLFVMVAFRHQLEDRNFDFSRVIGNHFSTPYRNFVRLGSVTPEFKT